MICEINNMLMHNHTHTRTHAHAHPPPHTRTNEASLFMFINIFQTRGSIEENHTYSNSRRRRQQNEKKSKTNRKLKSRTHALVLFVPLFLISYREGLRTITISALYNRTGRSGHGCTVGHVIAPVTYTFPRQSLGSRVRVVWGFVF